MTKTERWLKVIEPKLEEVKKGKSVSIKPKEENLPRMHWDNNGYLQEKWMEEVVELIRNRGFKVIIKSQEVEFIKK